MTAEQNMAGRLARIMGDVGRVEKKGKITSTSGGPNYKFARDSDVMEAVTPMMADAGIVMIPETQELLSMDPSMSGKQFVANIKTGWHVTDGKESIRFETFGQGADSGDKALPKAQSNARKYAFFMLFHIVTGDDPDHDASFDSERSRGPARAASSPSGSAPAQSDGALRDAVAAAAAEHHVGTARLSLIADSVGVPKGQRANADQLRAILAAIEQPSSVPAPAGAAGVAPSASAATTSHAEGSPDSSGSAAATAQGSGVEAVSPGIPPDPAPAPSMEDILAVTDGEEVTADGSNITLRMSPPPPLGSDEFKALPPAERATARVYWQTHAEPARPDAEALRMGLEA